jgi:tripartite-type tricarboxylate transporter receptor subunit TctC
MLKLRFVALIFLASVMVVGAGVVSAQDYPSRPIRIITSGVGGNSDFDARQIAQEISGPLGQPVIVDNRTSIQAAELVAKAPPDGYNLHVSSTLWIAPLLQRTPYDMSEFSPISMVESQANIVIVHPSLPVKSIKDLIALAKEKPGQLNYGSGATGGSTHLGVELLKSMAGVNIVRIQYKGSGPVIPALIGGEVQMSIQDVGNVVPQMKSGKLRALAVTSAEPSALAPGLPTVSASGLPGFEAIGQTGIFAPAKTPAAVINRLNREIVRFLSRADVKERFLNFGEEVVASSPEQLAAIIKSDLAKWGKVIKDAGIKVE